MFAGTIITEWDEGQEMCKTFLRSQETYEKFAEKLVQIAIAYGFEGWLINIENKLEVPMNKKMPIICVTFQIWHCHSIRSFLSLLVFAGRHSGESWGIRENLDGKDAPSRWALVCDLVRQCDKDRRTEVAESSQWSQLVWYPTFVPTSDHTTVQSKNTETTFETFAAISLTPVMVFFWTTPGRTKTWTNRRKCVCPRVVHMMCTLVLTSLDVVAAVGEAITQKRWEGISGLVVCLDSQLSNAFSASVGSRQSAIYSLQAVKAARNLGLSVALFAPGWVYENQNKNNFTANENK